MPPRPSWQYKSRWYDQESGDQDGSPKKNQNLATEKDVVETTDQIGAFFGRKLDSRLRQISSSHVEIMENLNRTDKITAKCSV